MVDLNPCLTYLKKTKRQLTFELMCLVFLLCVLTVLFWIKNTQSYLVIFWLSVSLLGLFYVYKRTFVSSKRKMGSFSYTSPKYLFELVVPNFLYIVTQLDFGCFKIENILFNDAGICLVDSFQSVGVLEGETMQYLLEFHSSNEQQCCRKVKNPFKTLLFKKECLSLIMKWYGLTYEIHSGLYLPHANWEAGPKGSPTEFLIEGVHSLNQFIKKFEKLSFQTLNKQQEHLSSSEDIIYVLMSIRYFDYLRQFYQTLMPLQKIRLKKALSPNSIILFEFVMLKDAFTVEKLEQFMNKNQKRLKVGIKTWQEQLFLELYEFFQEHQDTSFTPFNMMGLMMGEGFFIQENNELFN